LTDLGTVVTVVEFVNVTMTRDVEFAGTGVEEEPENSGTLLDGDATSSEELELG
jgi:hypothetical protein